MNNRRLFFGAGLSLIVLSALSLMAFMPGARISSQSAPTRTTTPSLSVNPLPVVSPTPSRTPARSALASPTPAATEAIPEAMMTMTAFSASIFGTFEAIPTDTPGPSVIGLTGKPHFVEFYADWCAPCRAMRPALRAMKAKYGDQVTFWDIDIDNPGSAALVRKYRVQFIPYMVLLDEKGVLMATLEGGQEAIDLDRALAHLVGK